MENPAHGLLPKKLLAYPFLLFPAPFASLAATHRTSHLNYSHPSTRHEGQTMDAVAKQSRRAPSPQRCDVDADVVG